MAFEELTSQISADASELIGETDDASAAMEDLGATSEDTSESLFDLEPAGVAAGGALAGVATAGQGLLDSTRDTREELGRTAQTVGMAQDEMVDLTTSLTDATFSIDEAQGALGTLAQQGIDTEEELAHLAETSDAIADATGSSADAVAEQLGPAMAAVGDDVEDMADVQDAVTLAVNESTLEFDEFTRQMERSSEEIQEMGLGTEEAAGLMSSFADETGLSGRELRREFDEALREADGSLEDFADSTGLSEDVLDDWNDELEDSEGITEDYADAASDNVSTMDRLRSGFADAKLELSEYLGPLEALMPAAQTAGIALLGMSTINMTALAPSFATVTAAASGLLLPIAAIAAAGAGLYAAWQRDLGGIRDFTKSAISIITDTIGLISETVTEIIDTVDYILTEWNPVSKVRDAFGDARDWLQNTAETYIVDPIESIVETAQDVLDAFVPQTVKDAVNNLVEHLETAYSWMEDIYEKAQKLDPREWGFGDDIIADEIAELDTVEVEALIEEHDLSAAEAAEVREMAGIDYDPDPGYETIDPTMVEGAATGGYIDQGGLLNIHEGEQVVPSAQVTDRGEVKSSDSSKVVQELRELRQTMERLQLRVEFGLNSREFGRIVDDRARAVMEDEFR